MEVTEAAIRVDIEPLPIQRDTPDTAAIPTTWELAATAVDLPVAGATTVSPNRLAQANRYRIQFLTMTEMIGISIVTEFTTDRAIDKTVTITNQQTALVGLIHSTAIAWTETGIVREAAVWIADWVLIME